MGTTPLNIEWIHHPVKMLCIHVSYDEKRNIETNFMIKLRKLQTKLDMCRSRDLTLFGRVVIIKSLGLSQLIYSISNLNLPNKVVPLVKRKLFNFHWKNKKGKIKRESLYKDLNAGVFVW